VLTPLTYQEIVFIVKNCLKTDFTLPIGVISKGFAIILARKKTGLKGIARMEDKS
jgi:hypothetical protein